MNKEQGLTPHTGGGMISADHLKAQEQALAVSVAELAKDVPHDSVRTYQNFKYIPIGTIENLLDTIYLGLWQTRKVEYSKIANAVVCSLELGVFNRAAGVWIWRVGIGGSPIQQNARSNVMDATAIKKTALKLAPPAAKAEAFKNAAKSFGKIFGRQLNRTDNEFGLEHLDQLDQFLQEMKSAASLEQLTLIYQTVPAFLRELKECKDVFINRQLELS